MSKKRKPGRPPGAKNFQRETVCVLPPHCPTCRSTDAESIKIVITHSIDGVIEEHHYTHVVYRNVKCQECGQQYRTRSYEHRPGDESEPDRDAGEDIEDPNITSDSESTEADDAA